MPSGIAPSMSFFPGKARGYMVRLLVPSSLAMALGVPTCVAGADTTVGSTGTGLLGSYYNNSAHLWSNYGSAPALTRVDATVNFNWGTGSPSLLIKNKYYSAVWSGYLAAPATGTYSILITSDNGRRVWLGGKPIIDQWVANQGVTYSAQVDLVAGQQVPVRVDYFQVDAQANIKLEWIRPDGVREVIPTSALYPEALPSSQTGNGTGLLAGYFPGPSFTGTPVVKVDPTLFFDWSGRLPLDGMPLDYFSVRWQGKVTSPLNEPITLIMTADDGARVWLDGKMVVDDWTTHAARSYRIPLPVGANVAHDVRVDYFQYTGSDVAQLEWESQHIPRQRVPSAQLTPAASLLTPAPTNGAGLSAAYFANEGLTGAPVWARAQNINVAWGKAAPHPAVPADHFGVRWSGYLQTRFDEDYTLIAKMDDVVRIWIDDVQVMNIDDWKNEHRYTFAAKAGQKYRLRVEMADHSGDAGAKLEWESASEGRQIVPESCFYPDDLTIVVPAASTVSPAFIEGLHGPSLTVDAGTGAILPLGASRFAVNQPLTAGAATAVQISAGTGTATGSITWTPTMLADADAVVRPGDALLIQAVKAGSWQIQKDCSVWREPAPIAAGDQVPVTFTDPGTYLVEQTDGTGAVVATLTVTVPTVTTNGRVPVSVDYTRVKDLTFGVAGDRDLITWTAADPWLAVNVGTTPSDAAATSKRFTVWSGEDRQSWMLGRIGGATGPVMTALEVRPFVMSYTMTNSIRVVTAYADGSLLCEQSMLMEPQVPGARVHLKTIVAGVTFDDATTSRWLSTTTDFVPMTNDPTNGISTFRLLRAPGVLTGVCHCRTVFDGDVQISETR